MSYQPIRPPRVTQERVRGLTHRLTWWGEPSEAPVVLLHGFMDCGATWQLLVDLLPASWACVAPDWRGFGGTGWAPDGYWFPDYLADLEELLARVVRQGRARVIAHSMGANIAAMYAGVRQGSLAWLANLEGIGLPRVAASEAPARYAQWLDQLAVPPKTTRYDSLAQLTEVLLRRNPRLTAERAEFVARAWTEGSGRTDEPGVVSLSFDPRHRLVNPVLYRREEAEACWARMQVPMLLLLGGRSELLARFGEDASDERLRTQYPSARIVRIPEVGHAMHYEDPHSVARHIVEFASACD
jgi:pimeloyl-ACP methyl ester carboxylesterase